ncbi:MAG: T9SS type A sorting domain-containing protein [Crocinitomicaceae bacterium]|nr:T9SS type A sorting domain-containing protein [Crocinitomicaceae bacterium]
MRNILLLSFLWATYLLAQGPAYDWTVQLTAVANTSPFSITLDFHTTETAGTDYHIFRKEKGANGWGTAIAILPTTASTYDDPTVTEGTSYEYFVQRRTGGTIHSWGYIATSIMGELPANRGNILVLVDSTHIVDLEGKLDTLEQDLYNDGWMPNIVGVGATATVPDVKGIVQIENASVPNLQALYIIGHVAVPYSGNLYPDAHTDHEGAWPADVYYGDMDGLWSDFSVDNTVASDSRNHNVPGDGKFDQSKVPGAIELQVCRVDFHDLPAYSESELDLLKAYLDRAHEFKIGEYVPEERALFDQGSFSGMAEGFAQNALRNFVPMFDTTNIDEIDYFTNLTSESYLWSYGCGPGSHTSAGSLDGGTSLTSAELAGTPMQTTFTMLFGSYFGDWDRSNNLLRAVLANGKTLSISWAGRPNWHYHTMAMGDNIGLAARMSMDELGDYISLTLAGGFVTGEGVHVAQLGDPSLRMYYIQPPSDLTVTNVSNIAELTWTASADGTIDGYNVYRRTSSTLWEKVNTSLIVGTSYSDATIATAGDNEFMVKAVKLKTNASGTFFNESLGTTGTALFTVSDQIQKEIEIAIFPNPTSDFVQIEVEGLELVRVFSLNGVLVSAHQVAGNTYKLDFSGLSSGVYVVEVNTAFGTVQRKISKL